MNSELRWVACSRDADWAASQYRHLSYRGSLHTLCGCTASHPEVWRGNSTKDECPQCVKVKEEKDRQFRSVIVEKSIREI
jgi:hypothetical protein